MPTTITARQLLYIQRGLRGCFLHSTAVGLLSQIEWFSKSAKAEDDSS